MREIMGKKLVSLILILCFTLSCLPSADLNVKFPAYEPYTKEEFPLWSQKLRRAETLFFGSLALTLPISVGGYNVVANYFPSVVPEEASKQFVQQALIAVSISGLIALVDYIIGECID